MSSSNTPSGTAENNERALITDPKAQMAIRDVQHKADIDILNLKASHTQEMMLAQMNSMKEMFAAKIDNMQATTKVEMLEDKLKDLTLKANQVPAATSTVIHHGHHPGSCVGCGPLPNNSFGSYSRRIHSSSVFYRQRICRSDEILDWAQQSRISHPSRNKGIAEPGGLYSRMDLELQQWKLACTVTSIRSPSSSPLMDTSLEAIILLLGLLAAHI